ncbi:MAG: hypothetical protein RJQ00_03640 [Vicingaceae bacterium]
MKKKTYFMLFVSAFTFFGLSALQNISYFTDFFGDIKITVNITTQEEENETTNSNNEESKESKCKNGNGLGSLSINHTNRLSSIAIQKHLLRHSTTILEVATPPPESFVV